MSGGTALTAFVEGEGIAAIFGVAPVSGYPKLGQVWCVGSDLIEHHKREFLTLSREWLEAANRRYPVLGNVIDARNEVSLRWLQWMGFSLVGKIDRFGVEQRPFIEFVKCAS